MARAPTTGARDHGLTRPDQNSRGRIPPGGATTGGLVPYLLVAETTHRYQAHHWRPPTIAFVDEPFVVALRIGTPAAEHAAV